MLTDFICDICKELYEDKVVFHGEQVICPTCNVPCERLVSLDASFRLKYDNKKDTCDWAAGGYSSSQYYKEQDKLCKKNIYVQGGTK